MYVLVGEYGGYQLEQTRGTKVEIHEEDWKKQSSGSFWCFEEVFHMNDHDHYDISFMNIPTDFIAQIICLKTKFAVFYLFFQD